MDSLVNKTLKTFHVPGIALAIIKDNHIIHAKGYGVRSIRTGEPVNEHTAFAIASNSKAFTAVALGLLVDEKKLRWDTKVTDVLPEFKMYDPYVTAEFTIRDLLTHRSGLGLGAGDLMVWPDSADFTKSEIIHNLRYLKPVSSFRTKFDYDNLLYIVAGEVIARLSGMSWEEFIERRILKPLNMTHSAASLSRMADQSNVIDAHALVDGHLQVIPRQLSEATNAAGGINSSVSDMSRWLMMLLNNGKYGQHLEKQLISEHTLREIWSPQTIYHDDSPYHTHFSSYGLGFFLRDECGYFVVEHTGGLAGMVTQVTLIPELKLGIIVFTNQQSGAAFTAISNQLKDGYYGIIGKDRIQENFDQEQAWFAKGKSATDSLWKVIEHQRENTTIDLASYVGTYRDDWFGKVDITRHSQHLFFTAQRSPKLKGTLTHYKGNTFIVRWNDRSLDADAYLIFSLNKDGFASSIKMQAISPLTDFSFDFQDLNLKRINEY
ncbi:serine hydrolase [Olivibacter ginsenosidimutans]|uniref:Serine hydrolase n=2 Tax=Olivibacter ginsenosidimutans TaxID=1176537 RepID=A0ABP9BBZ0_9SPHI